MKHIQSLTPAQKEDVRHGDYIFPVIQYICLFNHDNSLLAPHWHEEAELSLITEGTCSYHLNLEDCRTSEGDLIFIPPMMLHSIFLTDMKPMQSETYVFHMNFLGGNSADLCTMKYLKPLINQEYKLPSIIKKSHPAYDSLYGIFRQISSLYNQRPEGYELALKSSFLQVVYLLFPYRHQSNTTPGLHVEASDKLKSVLNYIETHYDTPLTVRELADLCFFSEYHFMRFFKKHTGMTCVEYINNLRLEKAVIMFEQGNTSILDVSLSTGFGNLSYFHRAFKKKYNITPRGFLMNLTPGHGNTCSRTAGRDMPNQS